MTFTPDDRSMWQHSSPLIRVQFSSISSLTGQATYELMPRHLKAKKQAFSAATGAIEVTSAGVDVPRQFQPCNNELNTTTFAKLEEYCRNWTEIIKHNLQACQKLSRVAVKLQSNVGSTQVSYRTAKMRAQKLHGARVRLRTGKYHMLGLANELVERLSNFRGLDDMCQRFPSDMSKVDGNEIIAMIKRIDSCTSFVLSRPKDALHVMYQQKSEQLRSRFLAAIRFHFSSTIKEAIRRKEAVPHFQSLRPLLNSGRGEFPSQNATKLSSTYCAVFRSAIARLRPIIDWVECQSRRCNHESRDNRDYVQVLQDCHLLYCEHRVKLIVEAVSEDFRV